MILTLLQLVAVVTASTIPSEISTIYVSEDGRSDFIQLATKYGLTAKTIEIVTEDDYVLTNFHIKGNGKPVILSHGLGDSSNTWLLRGKKSWAAVLAKEGFDLYFTNFRGNRYARRHLRLNPDTDDRFWDFSFQEMGYYDWAAMIDRVLKDTKATKVDVIAHTTGVTSLLILLNLRPEYNDKVNLCVGLAPIVYSKYPGRMSSLVTRILSVLMPYKDMIGVGELFGDPSAEKDLFEYVCTQGLIREGSCNTAYGLLYGCDPNSIEPEFLPTIVGQYPTGYSVKTLQHFDQMALYNRFAPYDSGSITNVPAFKNQTHQDYDLGKVTCKMALYYSAHDEISPTENVLEWSRLLPNVVRLQEVENKKWSLIDFTWGRELDKYLYGEVIHTLCNE